MKKISKWILFFVWLFSISMLLSGCSNFCEDNLSEEGFSTYKDMKLMAWMYDEIINDTYEQFLLCWDELWNEDNTKVNSNCVRYHLELKSLFSKLNNNSENMKKIISCENIQADQLKYLISLEYVFKIYGELAFRYASITQALLLWEVDYAKQEFADTETVLRELYKAQDKLQKIPVTEAEKAYQESYDYWEKN